MARLVLSNAAEAKKKLYLQYASLHGSTLGKRAVRAWRNLVNERQRLVCDWHAKRQQKKALTALSENAKSASKGKETAENLSRIRVGRKALISLRMYIAMKAGMRQKAAEAAKRYKTGLRQRVFLAL